MVGPRKSRHAVSDAARRLWTPLQKLLTLHHRARIFHERIPQLRQPPMSRRHRTSGRTQLLTWPPVSPWSLTRAPRATWPRLTVRRGMLRRRMLPHPLGSRTVGLIAQKPTCPRPIFCPWTRPPASIKPPSRWRMPPRLSPMRLPTWRSFRASIRRSTPSLTCPPTWSEQIPMGSPAPRRANADRVSVSMGRVAMVIAPDLAVHAPFRGALVLVGRNRRAQPAALLRVSLVSNRRPEPAMAKAPVRWLRQALLAV